MRINNHRGIEVIPVSSTAYAAQLASTETGVAAICSLTCASLYNLHILEEHIEDIKCN